MQFTGYTSDDSSYTFLGACGEVYCVPKSGTILVDDESGAISIKLTGSRMTLGTMPKE